MSRTDPTARHDGQAMASFCMKAAQESRNLEEYRTAAEQHLLQAGRTMTPKIMALVMRCWNFSRR